MAFFKREHKKLAKYSDKVLIDCYHNTEIGLRNAVASGDTKAIQKAMKRHQTVEYALLYKGSPEYLKKSKIIYTGRGRTIKQNNKRRN